jgi:hypothetical protein
MLAARSATGEKDAGTMSYNIDELADRDAIALASASLAWPE